MAANRPIGRILVLALVSLCLPATAQDDRGFELGFTAGFVQIDEGLAGPDGRKQEPTVGLRGGYVFDDRWGVSLDAYYSKFDTDTFRGDTTALSARVGAEFTFTPLRNSQWFVSGGIGYWDLDFDNALDYTSNFVSGGIGQHIWMGPRHQVRWEFRVDHSLADDGLTAFDLSTSDVTQAEFLVGFSFGLGGPVIGGRNTPLDTDGDGVRDRSDRCPDSQPGAAVNRRGCAQADEPVPAPTPPPSNSVTPPPPVPVVPATPTPRASDLPVRDIDNDGVTDDVDGCPATFKGIEVGSDGCPLDEDKDGVYDGLGMDKCLGTPTGVPVDTRGCPQDDGDADGVPNSQDRCPASAAGAEVDDSGCP